MRICGSEANTALPEERTVFDLKRSASIMQELGYAVLDRDIMLLAAKDGVEVSVVSHRTDGHSSSGEGESTRAGGEVLPDAGAFRVRDDVFNRR